MSEHAWVQDNLNAYFTGDLSAKDRARLERHLEQCAECAEDKAEIGEMEHVMEGIFQSTRPDAGLEDRAIQTLRRRRRARPSWLRFVSAAAAVIFLGMIGAGVQMVAFDGALPFSFAKKDLAALAPKLGVEFVAGTIFEQRSGGANDEGRKVEARRKRDEQELAIDWDDKTQASISLKKTEELADASKELKLPIVVRESEKKANIYKATRDEVTARFFDETELSKLEVKLDQEQRFYDRSEKNQNALDKQEEVLKFLRDTNKELLNGDKAGDSSKLAGKGIKTLGEKDGLGKSPDAGQKPGDGKDLPFMPMPIVQLPPMPGFYGDRKSVV